MTMTIFRDTTMLDFGDHAMPITAAEAMLPHHAKMVFGATDNWRTWLAIEHRAIWEAGYNAGLANGQPQWISVEDRLPDTAFDVLVCGDSGDTGISIGYYFRGIDAGRWFGNTNITHWMPLPSRPQVQQ